MPAGFIGMFGEPDARDKSPRDRAVWVARRGATQARQAKAETVGVSTQKAWLYNGASGSFSLDPTLSKSERAIGSLERFCALAIQKGAVPAEEMLDGIVQFVAGILSRHPILNTPSFSILGSLGKETADDTIRERADYYWRTLDHLIFNSRWSIIESGRMLATSDIGYIWLPGSGRGVLEIPIHPYAMLQISAGRSYYIGDNYFDIHMPKWSNQRYLFSQLALMRQAKEVYVGDPSTARLALEVMNEPELLKSHDLDPTILPDTRGIGFLATSFASMGGLTCWRRVHLAQQEWLVCHCDEDNISLGMSKRERADWRRTMEEIDKVAQASLPRRNIISPWDLSSGPQYIYRPRQLRA